MSRDVLQFEASSGTRVGAWCLLGFWLLFAAFWTHALLDGATGVAAYAWAGIALAGVALQAVRVRVLRQPLLGLAADRLELRGLLGEAVRYPLGEVLSAAILRRGATRRRATLLLSFDVRGPLRSLRGRWLFPVDELEDPKAFLAELLPRIPQAHVDASVQRYLSGEDGDDKPFRDRDRLR